MEIIRLFSAGKGAGAGQGLRDKAISVKSAPCSWN